MSRSISFIIPAFNAKEVIGDAIRSVLSQSHPALELIVVDDGSTDGTFEEALRQRDPRLSLTRRSNQGVARSRNLGLTMARSDFCCFLDADDALDPTFASLALDSIGEQDAISTAYADTDPRLQRSTHAWYPTLSELRIDRLRLENPLAIGATVFRTDVLREVARHFGDAFPCGTQVEDWECLLRFTSLGGRWAPPIEQPLMFCRLLPSSRSAQAERVWRDGLRLMMEWVPATARPTAERNWTLANLARALANESSALADRMLSTLETIREHDAPALIGALRVWVRRTQCARGCSIQLHDLLRRLGTLGPSIALQSAQAALAPSWSERAQLAAESLASHERLVVYGYGKNGREACRALDALKAPYSVIDDSPEFVHSRQITLCDLTDRHVVLVTPDRWEHIVRTLKTRTFSRTVIAETPDRATGEAA